MSECEAYQENISALLDGELNEEETRALRVHVESCPDCQAVFQAFSAVDGALPGAFPEAPAGLHEYILSGLRGDGSRQTSRGREREANARRQTRRIPPRRFRAALIAAACLVVVITGTALSGRFFRMGRADAGGGTASMSLPAGGARVADAGGNAYEDGLAQDTTAAEQETDAEDQEAADQDSADDTRFDEFAESAVEDARQRLEGFDSFTVFVDGETYEGEEAAAVVDEFFDSGPTDKILMLSVTFPEGDISVQLWYRDGKAVCSLNEDGIEVQSLEDLLAYFRV